jgi:hypothetical protein
MAVLEAVATEVVSAVDRQHHVDERERQRRQLETLHGIARRVTASLKAEEVLEFAVGETTTLVGADVAYLATLTGTGYRLRIVAQHGPVSDGRAWSSGRTRPCTEPRGRAKTASSRTTLQPWLRLRPAPGGDRMRVGCR